MTPLPTPALDAWTARGNLKLRDDLWVAACCERAAQATTDGATRILMLNRAREAMYGSRSWHYQNGRP